MKKVWEITKRVLLVLVSIIVLFALGTTAFVSCAPQFGALPKGDHLKTISESDNYADGKFQNLVFTDMEMSLSNIMKTMKEFMNAKDVSPMVPLPTRFSKEGPAADADTTAYLTWYGHSAFLLEIEGKRILLDPMFGPAASPISFFSPRYPYEEPIDFNDFKDIDAVIISHDHYDHLDYPSILKLNNEVKHFYTPLGVGAHLQRWGIESDRITELDWWEGAQLDGLTITAAPSRHFSGRGLTDRFKTQWASWAVRGAYENIYFSGDGGYASHFKEIGERLGPFDFTMMECGQYNEKWAEIHMMPEQTVQAHLDVKGKVMMPIHWGAFQLAVHTWTDPAERVVAAAEKEGVTVASPMIGERFAPSKQTPVERWWEGVRDAKP